MVSLESTRLIRELSVGATWDIFDSQKVRCETPLPPFHFQPTKYDQLAGNTINSSDRKYVLNPKQVFLGWVTLLVAWQTEQPVIGYVASLDSLLQTNQLLTFVDSHFVFHDPTKRDTRKKDDSIIKCVLELTGVVSDAKILARLRACNG